MYISGILQRSKILRRALSFLLSIFVFIIRKTIPVRKIDNNKVAVIALRKLGDAVFSIQALMALYKHHKNNLILICFKETMPIYRLVFNDVKIIPVEHESFYLNDRFPKKNLRRIINGLHTGVIIDLTGVITSATLLLFSRAKKIIGSNEDYFHSIYSQYVPNKKYSHLTDSYLEIVKSYLPVGEFSAVRDLELEKTSGSFILIHPFAGWRAKEWSFDKFIKLAVFLSKEYDCRIVASPGSISKEAVNELISNNLKFVETATVELLIDEIKKSFLFISNDSGPLQIAALLGKPTFTIYGPTNPLMHIPFGKDHRYIQKEIKCSPKPGEKFCFTNAGRNGCPSFECMNRLTFDEVYDAVKEFISELELSKKIIA